MRGILPMSLTVNLYYTGKDGSAKRFVDEMINSGVVAKIRQEPGNLKYHYFQSLSDPETILLIDSWENQTALDKHHQSSMMKNIAKLRDKYDLHMHVERYREDDASNDTDSDFIRQ